MSTRAQWDRERPRPLRLGPALAGAGSRMGGAATKGVGGGERAAVDGACAVGVIRALRAG